MEAFDPVIRLITDFGLESVYGILILTALRPLGLMFGFVAITFAIGPARVLRIGAALGLSLPLLVANADEMRSFLDDPRPILTAALAPKEFGIGFALGLLASLPYVALAYAGAITDQFRGETDSGLKDGYGSPISTFGMLYMIIGFSAFMTMGGFPNLIGSLYRSYAIWPLDTGFPVFSVMAAQVTMDLLTDTLLLAVRVAVPLLAALALIEMVCGVAARAAKRFNFYENAFLLKNLSAILALPILAMLVGLMTAGIDPHAGDTLDVLRLFFDE